MKIEYDNTRSVDFRAVLMAEMGLSNQFISEKTGLTPAQIGYRTRQCSVYRKDYRNGENEVSQKIMAKIGQVVGRQNMVAKVGVFASLREAALTKGRK